MTAADIAMPAAPNTTALAWLERRLDELPPARDDAAIEENLGLVRAIASPAAMGALLTEICSDEMLLARIAGRSYRHVNHFDKILLVDTPRTDGYRLTMHLWEPPYSATELDDELIHDHRFSFWSGVLTGELISQNFRIISGKRDAKFRQYRYSPQTDTVTTTANTYKYVGLADLQTLPASVETAGDAYYLAFDRVHRVVLPQARSTCTLVLRGPREREFSNVFNTTYPSYDTTVGNTMFGPAELRGKLERVHHLIEDNAFQNTPILDRQAKVALRRNGVLDAVGYPGVR